MLKNKNTSFLKKFISNNLGVGQSTGRNLFKTLGLNVRIVSNIIKEKQINEVNKKVQIKPLGKKLKDNIINSINFLSKNKTYKGIRHKLKYPVRGQRTHTNAKTKKKFKY
jgi:small subunit ribosomal protein S13